MSNTAGFTRSHQESWGAHVAGRALLGARIALARLRSNRIRPGWHRAPHPAPAPAPVPAHLLRTDEIRFRRLVSADEIACVLPLRREINLPLAGDPGFAALEKKETRAALSALSSGVDKSSAPSASCRWGRALRHARRSSPGRTCRPNWLPTAGK